MIPATRPEHEPSSFRDPDGFVFQSEGRFFRWVAPRYKDAYDQLTEGGLRDTLVRKGLLLPFEESPSEPLRGAYKILLPTQIPFVSYPYEWCFSQLKDAALCTLEIQRVALQHRMSLKDGSAYNIQFISGKPCLTDTLSFERYREGRPWVAFRQFCQHFLAPLALMSYRDVRLSQLLRSYLDGVPLDLARRLMPFRTWARPGLVTCLHLHSLAKHATTRVTQKVASSRSFSIRSFHGLVDHLQSTIESLRWRPPLEAWSTYDSPELRGSTYFLSKQRVLEAYLERLPVGTVWDFGANTGYFSRLIANRGAFTVSLDSDPACVEIGYLQSKQEGNRLVLPLVMDLTNPSASSGWANQERRSIFQRGQPDLILSLALVHHLVFGSNLSFRMVAELFAGLGEYLIVEFVPKDDPRAQVMLSGREDIFASYTQAEFESQFQQYFTVERTDRLDSSGRVMYLMRRTDRAC